MSFIAPMLDPSKGAGFEAQSGNVLNVNADGTNSNNLYNQAQQGLGQQQAFTQALLGQNGIGNQSAVFDQQQGLANQLQMQANGQGPNPAQDMLAQSTANNTANQAALMAGQRGSSANAGLIARQAAMQGSANQQQAAGQAATMGAQQQIAAQQQLQGQQANMANLATQQIGQQQGAINAGNQGIQNEQNNVLNSVAAQNNANVGMQSNMNNANAAIAGVNAGNQGKILGGIFGGAGAALGLAHGGQVPAYAAGGTVNAPSAVNPSGPQSKVGQFLAGYNQASSNGTGQPNIGTTPSTQSGDLQQGTMDFMKGIGKQANKQFGSGQPSATADGTPGYLADSTYGDASAMPTGSFAAPAAMDTGAIAVPAAAAPTGLEAIAAEAGPAAIMVAAKGGEAKKKQPPFVPYTDPPSTIPPQALKAARDGMASDATWMNPKQNLPNNYKQGGNVPGQAAVKGDSYSNDKVPAVLSPGEIVIPRHITQGPNAPKKAAAFVAAILAKNGRPA